MASEIDINKDIRGLSIKLLIGVVAGTITIVSAGLTWKNDIMHRIDEIRYQKSSDDRIIELRLKTLETTVDALKAQQEANRLRINKAQSE